MAAKNPLTVEATRGAMVESRHRVDAVVADAGGGIVHAWGDAARLCYPRSAIKPLQALALVETGAADAFAVTDAEVALATASHAATDRHTAAVRAWLERIGLGEGDLECGAHEPIDPETAKERIRVDVRPTRLDNNCSGKHAGMLTTAQHLGEETAGYTTIDHPVQRRLRALLSEMGGQDLAEAPEGIDGCGIPVYGMTLSAMARAMAGMADRARLAPARAEAARRIVAAMVAHPVLVAGRGRFDTLALETGAGAFACKTGAEGMYSAVLPTLGLGVALKVEDGAKRASETAMAAILARLGLLEGAARDALGPYLEMPVLNAAGDTVGVVRMAAGWDQQDKV